MTTLHDQIMNIQCDVTSMKDETRSFIYKAGFKEARHAAAELAISSDARIEELDESEVWNIMRYVYAHSNPHDSPQMLLSAKEVKAIILAAMQLKGQP